jgi:hypothetical protein
MRLERHTLDNDILVIIKTRLEDLNAELRPENNPEA